MTTAKKDQGAKRAAPAARKKPVEQTEPVEQTASAEQTTPVEPAEHTVPVGAAPAAAASDPTEPPAQAPAGARPAAPEGHHPGYYPPVGGYYPATAHYSDQSWMPRPRIRVAAAVWGALLLILTLSILTTALDPVSRARAAEYWLGLDRGDWQILGLLVVGGLLLLFGAFAVIRRGQLTWQRRGSERG